MTLDLTCVKPYGDTTGDGIVQLSFTLPVPCGEKARIAACRLVTKMGLEEPAVACMEDLGGGFTFFIIYGRSIHSVNYADIPEPETVAAKMPPAEINRFIREQVGRKIRVIGACIESDAHTVGIDAIMNMKGYNGHKGLESYSEMETINLGAQVLCEELVAKAAAFKADAILVSQVVTQKNVHVTNLTRLVEMLEAEQMRDRVVLVVGGPRITPALAKELGYDAGFGPNTYAEDVAAFVAQEMVRRGIR